jgi:spermidine synthase
MHWLPHRQPWRVSVVGLGTGTLALYGRPGDSFRFYDINPAVIGVAWRYFHYLSESAAKIDTVASDGRLGLEREPAHSLNMIALDAFSGDSIPIHLLTREAFQMYFARLAPGGVVVIHVTNRYLDIASVVTALAADLHKPLVIVHNSADEPRHVQTADWAILANRRDDLADLEPFNNGGSTRKAPVWTDDYSNLFEILR